MSSRRIIAFDPGERRIGVALSDESGKIAIPAGLIDRGKGYLDEICRFISEHEVREVVVGLPLKLDGSEGPAAESARKFAADVEKACAVEVSFYDERFTTVTASRAMTEGGLSTRKQKGKVDQLAATILLQSYLDSHQR